MTLLRGRRVRILDVALILAAVGLLGGLYVFGLLSLRPLLRPLIGLIGCLALGHIAPRTAVAMSLAAPFASHLPGGALIASQSENLGSALCVGVLMGSIGRQGNVADGRARKLVITFGLVNLVVLLALPHGESSALSLFQAVFHAVTAATAVTVLSMDVAHMARVAAPAGVVLSWVAYLTPELLVDRTTSTAGQNANGVGMVAAICLVFAVVGLLRDSPRWRILHAASAIVCGAGVVVSQSRGAYLDLAVAALVLVSGRLLTRRSIAGWARVALFVVLATWIGARVVSWAGTFTGRFAEAQAESESLQSRMDAAVYSLHEGLIHPLSGVGLTNLASYSSLHDGDALVRSHVVYLGIWGEVGAIAALLFGILCWRAVLASRRAGRQPLAVVVVVLAAGVSVNWWPLSGSGTIALAALAWGASLNSDAALPPAIDPVRDAVRSGAADPRNHREGPRQ